jgi:hypothetical protein
VLNFLPLRRKIFKFDIFRINIRLLILRLSRISLMLFLEELLHFFHLFKLSCVLSITKLEIKAGLVGVASVGFESYDFFISQLFKSEDFGQHEIGNFDKVINFSWSPTSERLRRLDLELPFIVDPFSPKVGVKLLVANPKLCGKFTLWT